MRQLSLSLCLAQNQFLPVLNLGLSNFLLCFSNCAIFVFFFRGLEFFALQVKNALANSIVFCHSFLKSFLFTLWTRGITYCASDSPQFLVVCCWRAYTLYYTYRQMTKSLTPLYTLIEKKRKIIIEIIWISVKPSSNYSKIYVPLDIESKVIRLEVFTFTVPIIASSNTLTMT